MDRHTHGVNVPTGESAQRNSYPFTTFHALSGSGRAHGGARAGASVVPTEGFGVIALTALGTFLLTFAKHIDELKKMYSRVDKLLKVMRPMSEHIKDEVLRLELTGILSLRSGTDFESAYVRGLTLLEYEERRLREVIEQALKDVRSIKTINNETVFEWYLAYLDAVCFSGRYIMNKSGVWTYVNSLVSTEGVPIDETIITGTYYRMTNWCTMYKQLVTDLDHDPDHDTDPDHNMYSIGYFFGELAPNATFDSMCRSWTILRHNYFHAGRVLFLRSKGILPSNGQDIPELTQMALDIWSPRYNALGQPAWWVEVATLVRRRQALLAWSRYNSPTPKSTAALTFGPALAFGLALAPKPDITSGDILCSIAKFNAYKLTEDEDRYEPTEEDDARDTDEDDMYDDPKERYISARSGTIGFNKGGHNDKIHRRKALRDPTPSRVGHPLSSATIAATKASGETPKHDKLTRRATVASKFAAARAESESRFADEGAEE